jgi:transposase-like protein
MRKKSKLILGLVKSKKLEITKNFFTDEQKIFIVEDYLKSGLTKREIWKKYTGLSQEHGQLLQWMRKFGFDKRNTEKSHNFEINTNEMKKKLDSTNSAESFEELQLKNRIKELEQQLKEAEMKAIAYSTMVDIAEKEFNIPIRKKFNTKP